MLGRVVSIRPLRAPWARKCTQREQVSFARKQKHHDASPKQQGEVEVEGVVVTLLHRKSGKLGTDMMDSVHFRNSTRKAPSSCKHGFH
jgi:hypothetical protein